jgi:DUF4097 and DUF4098 domain-containing protein YvlB
MSEQETYDRTLDAPPPAPSAVEAPPASTLPNEDYYRQQGPRRSARGAGLGIALVAVGLLLLAFQLFGRGVAIGGGTTTVVDQTLPGSRIELSTTSADVEVRTWSGPGIRVEAIQRGGSPGDYQIDVSGSGDTVRVTETSSSFFWCLFCSRGLSYRIAVPADAQASISTASGDIDIAGVAGAVSLGTVSGDVRAEDLAGGLKVETTSGEVRLNDVAGKLEVGTISGDVRLEDGQVNGASVTTTSGEIELDGVSGAIDLDTVSADISVSEARDGQLTIGTTSGDILYDGGLAPGGSNDITAISGDVKLRLPDDSDFRLDASTISGEIDSDFELSGGETGRRSLTGTAGDGGATLNIGTTSGEITIEQN